MNGVFTKSKSIIIYNIIGIVSGLFLSLLFGSFVIANEFETIDDIVCVFFLIVFGIFIIGLCGLSLYVNHKAFIHADDQSVSAFCHFGLSLNCDMSDIESISYGGDGLNIKLNNGKNYNLMHLANAYEVGRYIEKRIFHQSTSFFAKEELIAKNSTLSKKRKIQGFSSIGCFLLVFSEIFITSALTQWKELNEFSSTDWFVFAIMSVIGIIIMTVLCISLRKYLINTDEQNKTIKMLNKTILYNTALAPGNAIKLFVNDEYYPSFRVTVYGFPNSSEVYYTIEDIDPNYDLRCVGKSKIFTDYESLSLSADLELYTEIPLPL